MFTISATKHFKRKIHTNSSCYSKRKVESKRVGSLWKLSEFYFSEFMDLYFYLCECDYHHDCVDIDASAVGTAYVDEDLMALYLGYYDWNSLQHLYMLDLWIVHFL
jgi:hypothetical protein